MRLLYFCLIFLVYLMGNTIPVDACKAGQTCSANVEITEVKECGINEITHICNQTGVSTSIHSCSGEPSCVAFYTRATCCDASCNKGCWDGQVDCCSGSGGVGRVM